MKNEGKPNYYNLSHHPQWLQSELVPFLVMCRQYGQVVFLSTRLIITVSTKFFFIITSNFKIINLLSNFEILLSKRSHLFCKILSNYVKNNK